MGKLIHAFFALLIAAALGALAWSVSLRNASEREISREAGLAAQLAVAMQRDVVLFFHGRARSGQIFSGSLAAMGVAPDSIGPILLAAQSVFDFRHFRAGHELSIGRSVMGQLRAVSYRIDPEHELWIAPLAGNFHAEIKPIPITTENAGIAGRVENSLFNAVTDAGERAELALSLADIFGWDMDFNTDTRPGDTFRLVVEKKKYADGTLALYGRILLAEYVNAGHRYQAVLFHDAEGHPAYYGEDGKALKKAFLRSPLVFHAPITSHFSYSRFHPILKIYRPHLGIDYGAPEGAPVQTIGSGRVIYAAQSGGEGNMVRIRHTNGYETMYMHLSRILVRNGQQVEQGQRIGLVGHTGLATGPHLDFRIKQNGVYRNFETLKLPPADPVSRAQLPQFIADRDRWIALLPSTGPQVAQAIPPATPVRPSDRAPNP
ncbi:MAG TPA: peptidoglycan DD-metalloendopeptidase family protein [Candidatus Acidoferrales bacterium]|nr:peptidoglycan DD-metalloendopeptidase family protein [Candidatus Acidoferrales bacterium]